VTARVLNVRERPDLTARVLGGLNKDRQVFAIGTSGDWFAIEFRGGTAFVHQDWVELKPAR
jgi:Bacterial SH3 domain